jgi:hypothetical protein
MSFKGATMEQLLPAAYNLIKNPLLACSLCIAGGPMLRSLIKNIQPMTPEFVQRFINIALPDNAPIIALVLLCKIDKIGFFSPLESKAQLCAKIAALILVGSFVCDTLRTLTDELIIQSHNAAKDIPFIGPTLGTYINGIRASDAKPAQAGFDSRFERPPAEASSAPQQSQSS